VVRRGSRTRNPLVVFKSLPRLLARTIRIPIARYAQYKPDRIWGMAILTAMNQTSLEQTKRLQKQLHRSLTPPNIPSKRQAKKAKDARESRKAEEAEEAEEAGHVLSSPDTVLYHLHKLGVGELTQRFNQIIAQQVKEAKKRGMIPKTKTQKGVVLALDTTTQPYYGKKKNRWVLGCKRKAGTNWAYTMATIEVVEKNKRLCLAAQPVNQLVKIKKIVYRLVRAAKRHVKIRLLLLDRGFFSIEVIQSLNRHRIPWLMPVIKNKEIEEKVNAIYRERRTAVVSHILGDKKKRKGRRHVKINLIILPPLKTAKTVKTTETTKTPKTAEEVDEEGPSVFATNMDVGQCTEDWPRPLVPLTPVEQESLWAQRLAEIYRKRWGIETGYRVKKDFKAKTCSVCPSVRFVFFFLSIILYNVWVLINGEDVSADREGERHVGIMKGSGGVPRSGMAGMGILTTTTTRWLYILVLSPLLSLERWT